MPWVTQRVRRFGLLLLGILAIQGITAPAFADGLEDARRRGHFLAGVKTDFPPFGYRDEQGNFAGFDVAIARQLAEAFFDDRDRVRFVAVTSGSRIPFLYSGWIDFIVATMTITDERKQVLEFSEPYFISGSLLLVDQASSIQSLADIAGKTVAVIAGSVQEQDLEQVAPQAKQVNFDEVSQAVQALKDGTVDAFCQDDILILTLAQDDSRLKAVGKTFLPRPYAIAVRKGETEFIAWINARLAEMKSDGTYDRLWQEYFAAIEEKLIKP